MVTGKDYAENSHERLCLNVPEVAKLLGISRGLAYELVHTGQLPAVHLGRRILIPRVALEQMLRQTKERPE